MSHDYDLDQTPEAFSHIEREALYSEASGQAVLARDFLDGDPLHWVRYPYDALHRLTGPLAPGEYHLLLALTGNGKSTFLLNVIHHWLLARVPVYMLPFEVDPETVRLMLAGVYCGYDPRLVARLAWGELPAGAKENVAQHLLMQTEDWHMDLLRLDPSKQVGWQELRRLMGMAARQGYRVLVVDHFDRFQTQSYMDTKRLAETLKEGAKEFGLAVLCANQVSRIKLGSPHFRQNMPPGVDDAKGGNTVSENADCILSLYRPLVETMTKADLAMVKAGLRDAGDFTDGGKMAVKVIKSRWTSHAGKVAMLTFDGARLSDPDTEHRTREEARYGI